MTWIKARWNGLAFNMHHYYLAGLREKEKELFGLDGGKGNNKKNKLLKNSLNKLKKTVFQ